MPPLRPNIAIGIPSRPTANRTLGKHPIGSFRCLFESSANQIAPGHVQSRPRLTTAVKRLSIQRMPRRGVGTKSPFEHWGGTTRASNTAGALLVALGASAIAVLAAPCIPWVQERTEPIKSVDGDVAIDVTKEAVETSKIRLLEVIAHDEHADTQWIVRGTRVYDITDFVACHPGGKVILRACGGSIDPYWNLFSIHQKPEVRDILSEYYIGDIDERDLDAQGNVEWTRLGTEATAIDDPFKDDPERDPNLLIRTPKPCNAETPGKFLSDFLTPVRLFFVRNHLWVPCIKAENHKLEVELSDGEELSFSMDDLKTKFPQHTITVTLQCAGNRRGYMNQASNGTTSGLAWDVGAIGTAEFTGVRLKDLLLARGYDVQKACEACPNNPNKDRHIHFVAPADTYEQSIPLHAALNPASDVILAYEMNGEAMPRDHGGPLRAIVPGSVATRSVKWVGKVRVSCEESQSNWHTRDYKCFGPNGRAADLSPADWEEAQSIQELPVQSAITNIVRAGSAAQSAVSNQGFAYSGGGRRIVRVDVSTDGGKTWKQAELRKDNAKGSKRWAWTLWNVDWPEALVAANAEFVVKAVDEAHNCQPQTFDENWNFRGLLGNAWHRVPLASQIEA